MYIYLLCVVRNLKAFYKYICKYDFIIINCLNLFSLKIFFYSSNDLQKLIRIELKVNINIYIYIYVTK